MVVTLLLAVAAVGLVLAIGIEDHAAVPTRIVGVVVGAVGLWKIPDITGAAGVSDSTSPSSVDPAW